MAEFVPVSSERQRLTFGRARDLVEIPDMIEVQRDSYNWFYQEDTAPEARVPQGLQELLHEVFPIESYDGSFALEFVRYLLDEPSTEEEESRQRDLTWSRPIRATIRLVNRKTKEMKEEEIFLGDFPLMTGRGTFIINGTERVVVNQLARSAGVYFTKDEQIPGQEAYSAKIIPDRGAWLEFSLTPGDLISVNIDNRKKIPATLLLKIFGASTNEGVLDLFDAKKVERDVTEEDVKGMLSAESVLDQDGGTVLPGTGPSPSSTSKSSGAWAGRRSWCGTRTPPWPPLLKRTVPSTPTRPWWSSSASSGPTNPPGSRTPGNMSTVSSSTPAGTTSAEWGATR
jgi:DNA-directed RNA polymerase subunit beta